MVSFGFLAAIWLNITVFLFSISIFTRLALDRNDIGNKSRFFAPRLCCDHVIKKSEFTRDPVTQTAGPEYESVVR